MKPAAAAPTAHLKKVLGTFQLWGIAVGLVISGEYFGWSYGWASAGTLGFLVATLLVATMYTTFIFSFTELSTAIPHAGGPFAYARRAFGPQAVQLVRRQLHIRDAKRSAPPSRIPGAGGIIRNDETMAEEQTGQAHDRGFHHGTLTTLSFRWTQARISPTMVVRPGSSFALSVPTPSRAHESAGHRADRWRRNRVSIPAARPLTPRHTTGPCKAARRAIATRFQKSAIAWCRSTNGGRWPG